MLCTEQSKFGSRSRKCIFLRYPFGQKGWKVEDLDTQEVFVSRDVIFSENEFAFTSEPEAKSNWAQLWTPAEMLDDFGKSNKSPLRIWLVKCSNQM